MVDYTLDLYKKLNNDVYPLHSKIFDLCKKSFKDVYREIKKINPDANKYKKHYEIRYFEFVSMIIHGSNEQQNYFDENDNLDYSKVDLILNIVTRYLTSLFDQNAPAIDTEFLNYAIKRVGEMDKGRPMNLENLNKCKAINKIQMRLLNEHGPGHRASVPVATELYYKENNLGYPSKLDLNNISSLMSKYRKKKLL